MSIAHDRPAAPTTVRGGHWPMLTALLSAMFLAQFDFFVVNVAAPSLQRQLGTSPAMVELVVGGYAFAFASGMITGGRLGDIHGYRRVFVLGMLAFTATSLLCGIALTPLQLVLARLLQGLAAALMVPQVLAVITAALPDAAKPRALGAFGAASGAGALAGQVLGGLLLDSDVLGLGWRTIFLVNVPIGLIAAGLAARILPRMGADRAPRLDPLGALGMAATLALVVVPLTLGHTGGWPAWTWLSMAAAVPVGGITLYWQRRLARRGGQPVVDLSLFRLPSFVIGIVALATFYAYFASFMLTLAMLLQDGLGLTAFQAGLAFLPMGVSFVVASMLGSRLIARYGQRLVVVAALVVAIGLLSLAALLHTAGGDTNPGWITAAISLVGLGNGIVLPKLIGVALIDVRPHQAGIGSGVLTTGQQFSGAMGVAAVGSAFFAIAGPDANPATLARAMESAALIHTILMLAVAALVAGVIRRAWR